MILFYFFNIKNDNNFENIQNYYMNYKASDNLETKTNNSKIVVHIDGQIKKPGVYYINSTCILNDLITICGGFTDNANTKNINLASKLSDGEKIYIYSTEEEENYLDTSSLENGKININKASKEQLMTLPGIGDSTAQKIINYRKSNGDFRNTEDLMNVNGIGSSKYDNISSLICI